jgi:hypothetical protein
MIDDTKPPQVHHLSPNIDPAAKKLLDQSADEISGIKAMIVTPTTDDSPQNAHSYDSKSRKNFDEKIMMFPESYNALRRELYEQWPELWPLVGWAMAHKSEEFVTMMNAGLQVRVQFDSAKVDEICQIYLDLLRKKRGLGSLH